MYANDTNIRNIRMPFAFISIANKKSASKSQIKSAGELFGFYFLELLISLINNHLKL